MTDARVLLGVAVSLGLAACTALILPDADEPVDGTTPSDASISSDADPTLDSALALDAADAPAPEVAPGVPVVVCLRRIHGPGRHLVYGVAGANDGRIAVMGGGQDATSYDFGAGPVPGGLGSTGFIAVYDAACNPVWSRILGPVSGQGAVALKGVAFDAAGNLVIAGIHQGTIDFGTGPITAKGQYDLVVAKLDAAYRVVYALPFGDASGQSLAGMGLDATGNVYLGGSFNGTIDFGGDVLVSPRGPRASVFVAKLDVNGAHLFSKAFVLSNPGSYPDSGPDSVTLQMGTFDVGPAGDVSFGGDASNAASVDFGGGPLSAAGPAGSFRFAVRLAPGGQHLWSRAFPSLGLRTGRMVDGDVVMSVSLHVPPFGNDVDFGKGPISGPAALVRTASTDGSTRWSKSFPVFGTAIATPTGGMLMTSSFTGTVDLGCGSLTSAGSGDLVFARLTRDGDCLYAMRFGDAMHQYLSGSAMTPGGRTVLVGSYHGTLQIGATTLPNDDTRVTSDPQGDTEDGFIAVFTK